VQTLDADGARFGELEARAFEQAQDLREIDVTVSVPKVRGEAPSLRLTLGEVNEEHPAAGLENSAQFRGKFSPGGSAEVMKHHRAKGQIEASIRKRERLRGGILESNLDTRPRRFRARASQHLRRGIDAADRTGAANGLLCENRERTGPTRHIEDRLAGPYARQIEKPLPQLPLAPSQGEPYDYVVEHRGVQDSANGPRPRHRALTRHSLDPRKWTIVRFRV
jgi:hypothetical protein